MLVEAFDDNDKFLVGRLLSYIRLWFLTMLSKKFG